MTSMRAQALRLAALAAVAPLAGLIGYAQSAPIRSSPTRVDFTRQIRPLLSDRCFRCHGPDPGKRKAKLRLDTREGAFRAVEDADGWFVVKPLDPDRSEIIRRTSSDDPEEMMPPPESLLTLSADEKALLRRWVSEGADYKPHWSLTAVASAVPVPRPRIGLAPANPIDAFVRARLEQDGLTPAPPAAREAIIRRLAFNLTGLPPTPAEIDAF